MTRPHDATLSRIWDGAVPSSILEGDVTMLPVLRPPHAILLGRTILTAALLGLAACASAPPDGEELVVAPPPVLSEEGASLSGTVDKHFDRAERSIDRNDYADAVAELQEAARRLAPGDPRMVRCHERMGGVYLLENDVAAAKEAFTRAIKLAKQIGLKDEAVADAYVGVAMCLEREGKSSYAKKFYEKALGFHPSEDARRIIQDKLGRPR